MREGFKQQLINASQHTRDQLIVANTVASFIMCGGDAEIFCAITSVMIQEVQVYLGLPKDDFRKIHGQKPVTWMTGADLVTHYTDLELKAINKMKLEDEHDTSKD